MGKELLSDFKIAVSGNQCPEREMQTVQVIVRQRDLGRALSL